MKKEFLAVLLTACVLISLFSACGGGGGEPSPSGEPTSDIETTVPVSETPSGNTARAMTVSYVGNDSLNPFKACSEINRQLMYLLYDGLFYLAADYTVQPALGTGTQTEGTEISVTLRDGAVFSDGSAVTADSVVVSFNLAKASPLYALQLANFVSCVSSAGGVVFTLSQQDVNAAACLTFPIIKAEADEPVGAGRYCMRSQDGVRYLELNRKNTRFSISLNGRLELYDVSLSSTAEYAFMTGKTSVYLDTLADGEYTKLSSKTCSVQSGNLVFLGINSANTSSVLSLEYVRRAINIGLDRNAVGGSPFHGQSLPASTPFPSSHYALRGLELNPDGGDRERAIKVLEEGGFTGVNASGVRSNGRISLRISVLVPSESEQKRLAAQALKEDFARLGINLTVKELPFEEYKAAIAAGAFEMYIGEVKLSENFSLDVFYKAGGAASYGISQEACALYLAYEKGEIPFSEFIEGFYTAVPFIPLCYRQYVMSYDESLSGVEAAAGDLYYSVYSWE